MPDKYELKPYEMSRVRYYDGEYLRDDEFIDEQRYHIDRRQRHDRLLHITGVCEGMALAIGNPTTLLVRAGTAVDNLGRPMLLDVDRSVPIAAGTTGNLLVQIQFRERADRPANPNEAVASTTRFTQDPLITLGATALANAVILGQATITNGTVSAVTTDGRIYSGIRLPSAGSTGFSLRARGDGSSYADLNCSLNVTGNVESDGLRVRANATITGNTTMQGTLNTTGNVVFENQLTVKKDADLQAALNVQGKLSVTLDSEFKGNATIPNGTLGIGTSTPRGRLHVAGDIALGLDENNKRFIIHSRTNGNGDFLQITNDNPEGSFDYTRGIVLARTGNVGISQLSPQRTLHVNGNALVTGGLTANGINIGTNGAQTTYPFPYETIGSDSTNHNLRICSRNNIYMHPISMVQVARRDTGEGGHLIVDGSLGVGTTNPYAKGHIAGDLILGDNITNRRFIFHCRPTIGDFMQIAYDKTPAPGSVVDWEWNRGIRIWRNGTMEIMGNFANNSTRENKENIETLSEEEAALAFGMLQPKKYKLKDDESELIQAGFIAEETPELVATADHKAIRPTNIIAILTKIVHMQQRAIDELRARIDKGLPATGG